MLYVFLVVIAASIFFTFKKKKPSLLAVPFAALFLYMIVEIARVPDLGFIETVKFIFSLN